MNLLTVAPYLSRRTLSLTFTALLVAALAGCGQMGPLYQPPAEDPENSEEQ